MAYSLRTRVEALFRWYNLTIKANLEAAIVSTKADVAQEQNSWDSPPLGLIGNQNQSVSPQVRGSLVPLGRGDV